jgi:PhnB protein
VKAVNPYLNFNGNTEEAFNFYKSVFGGEFINVMRFKDIPNETPQDQKSSEKQLNMIMHISLQISPHTILMGSDAPESMGFNLIMGNNLYIYLQTDSKEEADNIFAKLSAGGKIEMPMADQFWGDYFGSFQDKFGVHWMISKEGENN